MKNRVYSCKYISKNIKLHLFKRVQQVLKPCPIYIVKRRWHLLVPVGSLDHVFSKAEGRIQYSLWHLMKNVKASKESAFHQTKFSSTVLAASLSFLGEAFTKRKYKFKYLPLSALSLTSHFIVDIKLLIMLHSFSWLFCFRLKIMLKLYQLIM